MKQSAVEYLIDQLDFELELYNSQWVKLEQTFAKAKEMEKQQQSYSEEEVLEIIYKFKQTCPYFIEEWFNKFKK